MKQGPIFFFKNSKNEVAILGKTEETILPSAMEWVNTAIRSECGQGCCGWFSILRKVVKMYSRMFVKMSLRAPNPARH